MFWNLCCILQIHFCRARFSPSLTWRDMQHIVVMTSRPEPMVDGDWVTNGVGRKGKEVRDFIKFIFPFD